MIHQTITAHSQELETFLFDLRERLLQDDVEVVDTFEHLHPQHHKDVPRMHKNAPPHVGWRFTQKIGPTDAATQFFVTVHKDGLALFSATNGNYSFNAKPVEVKSGAFDTVEVEFRAGTDIRREWYIMYKKACMARQEDELRSREEIKGKARMLWDRIKPI